MVPKLTRGLLVLAAVLSVAVVLMAGSSDERPPFVSADDWVPLSEREGLVITEAPKTGKPLVWLNGRPSAQARGQLWVKVHDAWYPAHLEQPEGGIVPAR